jgi:hypothetical protein
MNWLDTDRSKFDFPARPRTSGLLLFAKEEECSEKKSSAKASLAGSIDPNATTGTGRPSFFLLGEATCFRVED